MELEQTIKEYEDMAKNSLYEAKQYDTKDGYESLQALGAAQKAEEYQQIANWLKELAEYKDMQICNDYVSKEDFYNTLRRHGVDQWKADDCVKLVQIVDGLLPVIPRESLKQ